MGRPSAPVSIDEAAQRACDRLGLMWRPGIPQTGRWIALDIDGDRRGKGDGRIKFFADGFGGLIQNWKLGPAEPFFTQDLDTLTPEQRRKAEEIRQKAIDDAAAQAFDAGLRARTLWESCPALPATFAYLQRKQVKPHGARLEKGAPRAGHYEDALVIPIYGPRGEQISLQRIFRDGVKRTFRDAYAFGGYYEVETVDYGPILIAEGFSTAATLAETMGLTAVCAFFRANLLPVARYYRARFPDRAIIICADNDKDGRHDGEAAAFACGGRLAVPDLKNRPGTDFNDLFQAFGAAEVKGQVMRATGPKNETPPATRGNVTAGGADADGIHEDHIRQDIPEKKETRKSHANGATHPNHPDNKDGAPPADYRVNICRLSDLPVHHPPQLIKRLLPRSGLTILGGQPDAGKTFIALHLAHCLGHGIECFGYPVRETCAVLILAAEGQATLGARRLAVEKHLGVSDSPVFCVDAPPILGTSEEIRNVQANWLAAEIKRQIPRIERECGLRAGVVIVDTVSSFMQINKEEDNAEIAQVCSRLKRIGEECDVLLLAIHHMGKDAERGLRGASAWKGNSDHILGVLCDQQQSTGEVASRSFHVLKNRVGAEGIVSAFELTPVEIGENEYGEVEFSCAISMCEGGAAVKQKEPAEKAKGRPDEASKILKEAFLECLNEHPVIRQIIDNRGPRKKCVKLSNVETIFLKRWPGDNTRAKKQAFKRAYEKATGRDFSYETTPDNICWMWSLGELSNFIYEPKRQNEDENAFI